MHGPCRRVGARSPLPPSLFRSPFNNIRLGPPRCISSKRWNITTIWLCELLVKQQIQWNDVERRSLYMRSGSMLRNDGIDRMKKTGRNRTETAARRRSSPAPSRPTSSMKEMRRSFDAVDAFDGRVSDISVGDGHVRTSNAHRTQGSDEWETRKSLFYLIVRFTAVVARRERLPTQRQPSPQQQQRQQLRRAAVAAAAAAKASDAVLCARSGQTDRPAFRLHKAARRQLGVDAIRHRQNVSTRRTARMQYLCSACTDGGGGGSDRLDFSSVGPSE